VCVEHPVSYAVTVDPSDNTWFLALEVRNEAGQMVEGNYRRAGDPTSGVVGIRMCGGVNEPGTFTLQGRLLYGLTNSTPVPPTTFSMRNPYTNTAIKPSTTNPRKGQKVAIKIKSRDEMPGGYERKAGATVLLQEKTKSGWKKVKGSKAETNEKGKAKVTVRYTGGRLKLRAVTKGSADWDRSHSRRVVLR
jgi:hypothetical protein